MTADYAGVNRGQFFRFHLVFARMDESLHAGLDTRRNLSDAIFNWEVEDASPRGVTMKNPDNSQSASWTNKRVLWIECSCLMWLWRQWFRASHLQGGSGGGGGGGAKVNYLLLGGNGGRSFDQSFTLNFQKSTTNILLKYETKQIRIREQNE